MNSIVFSVSRPRLHNRQGIIFVVSCILLTVTCIFSRQKVVISSSKTRNESVVWNFCMVMVWILEHRDLHHSWYLKIPSCKIKLFELVGDYLYILIDFVTYFRPHGAPVKPPPLQDPLIFIKPSSTYLKPGGKIKVNNVKDSEIYVGTSRRFLTWKFWRQNQNKTFTGSDNFSFLSHLSFRWTNLYF